MAAKTPSRSRDSSRLTSSFLEVLASLALTGTVVQTMQELEQTMPADAARRWLATAGQRLLPVQMLVVWGTRAAEVCCVATEPHLELIVMRTQRLGAWCPRVLSEHGFVHRENGSLALRVHRSRPSGRVPPGAACHHGCGPSVAAARVLLCSLSRDKGRRDAGGPTAVDAPQAGLVHLQAARAGAQRTRPR